MAFIRPTGERYDPSQDLTIPGSYWCRLVGVEQGKPHHKFAGKLQIVFRFKLEDARYPKLKGKIVSIVAQETVYRDSAGKESHLVIHARNMGWPTPERGFDPEEKVGQMFMCQCIVVGERCYVRTAIPQGIITPTSPPLAEPQPPTPAPPIDGETYPPY